ncbi:MAG: NTP pyrophosphatase (non-canonical NTP hydrolase) [Halobacteriales archaeon]|jgi:NTP pyrophosphatase (non-canonical NTP hydrolase)
MDAQDRVATFVTDNDLEAPPAYRLLDLTSELGEVAEEMNESTTYGTNPEALAVAEDEIGDALFALLALAEQVDVDAEAALATALEKYETRIESTGGAGSDR